jgi:hypothetical protein
MPESRVSVSPSSFRGVRAQLATNPESRAEVCCKIPGSLAKGSRPGMTGTCRIA